ncbi:MAG: hypothetical protein LUE11_12900 [Clostridia bacterium]|nr:hypothetical protein [Clostridia bacterium]
MKRFIRKMWGCIPLVLWIAAAILIYIIERTTELSFRSIPKIMMLWCLGIFFALFLLWVYRMLCNRFKGTEPNIGMVKRVATTIFIVIFTCCGLLICVVILMLSVILFIPEHVVVKNDICMIARVHSYLDENVFYYEYKNPIFYGKELGYEYYGSGSQDPLTESPQPEPIRWCFYDLNGNIIESGSVDSEYDPVSEDEQAAQLLAEAPHKIEDLNFIAVEQGADIQTFSVSIDDFISTYNGYYYKNHGESFLYASSQWTIFDQNSDDRISCYRFQQNANRLSEPTISIYVSKEDEYIEKITLDFDDHGYTEWAYELYQQECYYTFKTLFPDYSDDDIVQLFDRIYNLAGEDICFITEKEEIEPAILYYKGEIGLYPYYAAGMVHICIIPVTQNNLEEYTSKGVEVHEIS